MVDEPQTIDEPEVVIKVEPEAEIIKDPAVNDLVTQYKELEARSEAQRVAKEDAQKRARVAQDEAAQARREADTARSQVASSNLDTVTTALASANTEAEAAKRDIKLAGEAGDYEAQANAYERLAAAKALSLRYDEAKADLEARKTQPQRQISSTDPVEAYIQGRTEPTANWLRGHKDFITDSRKNAKLTSAHWDAVGEGLAPDTDAYFEHVETFIGLRTDDTPKAVPKKVAVRQVAPVAGSGGSGGAAANEVRLSAREAAAAVDGTHLWNYDDSSPQKRFKKGDPIGVQEFARRKQKLIQQGAYDRSYETQ